jgi:hypothetical protein
MAPRAAVSRQGRPGRSRRGVPHPCGPGPGARAPGRSGVPRKPDHPALNTSAPWPSWKPCPPVSASTTARSPRRCRWRRRASRRSARRWRADASDRHHRTGRPGMGGQGRPTARSRSASSSASCGATATAATSPANSSGPATSGRGACPARRPGRLGNRESNLAPARSAPHAIKSKADLGKIRKADRCARDNFGLKAKPKAARSLTRP